jgi:poly-gamma-glutamate biosynthesis protein PgsC/CapC
MLAESVGIGIIVSLFMVELVGVAAGGIVVPGYFAFYFDRVDMVLITAGIAFVVLGIIKLLEKVVVIYGRRLLVISLLLGYIIGQLMDSYGSTIYSATSIDVQVIGYVIPGLMAYWMHRQGMLRTVSALIIGAVFTRGLLILLNGGALVR